MHYSRQPGQGVRIAIYARNLLCFLPVIMHLWDRRITKDEMKAVKEFNRNARHCFCHSDYQATGRQPSITNYYAALVLNPSWMNNTSTWIWFILYAQYRSEKENPTPPTWEA